MSAAAVYRPNALTGADGAVARRWRVIPVYPMQDAGTCGCGNRCEPGSRGKHPIGARWQERASADPAQVAQWARTHPGCNWGVATGEASDLYVVDLDLGEEGEPLGEQTWVALFGPIPDTHRVQTGSGATQVYFRYPRRPRADGRPWRNTAKLIGPGIDTRGEGGQCVLPGSTSGKGTYELIADPPLLDVPEAVLDQIEAAEREAKATRRSAGPPPDTGAVVARPPAQLVRGRMHPWAQRAFENTIGDFRALVGEGNGRTNKLAGAALRLSSLANATPPTGLTETMIRATLLEAAEANGYITAHGAGPTEYQIDRGLADGRAHPPAGWPPPERPTGTWGLTEADVRAQLAAGAAPGELHAELVTIDGEGLVDRLGVRQLLRAVPGPSLESDHDPTARDDPQETGEPAAAGWVLDVSAPTLDPPRAEVFGPWVAVQLARHLTATRQGRETAVSVTDRVRELWGACAPLWCRGCAVAGLAYYPESNLDAAEVCEAFVAAAVESGAEGLAELTTEQLAAAFRSGWDTGLTEPMLPMADDDPARPARGRGKRGVLPDAAAMRAAVRKATVDGESAESPVEVLVEFAREHWVFGNDGAGMLYAVPTSGPRLVVRVGERSSFRRRLTQRVYEERHRSFRGDSYSVALEVLRSIAEQAEPAPVHLRVARWRDGVVLDLGGTDARFVEVTPAGWRIVDAGTEHPLFRRSGHTTALPEPVPGGNLGVLALLLGYDPDSWEFRLVVGALMTALLAPNADRPALWWTGPEGAGKTLRSGLVTAVLDPRGTSERATGGGQLGRSAEDILVAAASRYVVTFDNLTSISTRQSDLLCGIVTGTVQEGRQRFTDDEVVVVAVQRAMSITSRRLPTGVGSDLLDRLIVLAGARMGDRQRRTPDALWGEFEREHAAILGGLLDLAVRVLARRDQVEREVTGLPRMATHGLILATLDAITGAGYLDAYTAAVEDVKGEQAESDPLIGAVIDAVERNNGSWIGPAGDLLELLARPEDQADPWPANGRVLSQRLRAAAELLRAAGIKFDVKKSNSVRNVYLSTIAEDAP